LFITQREVNFLLVDCHSKVTWERIMTINSRLTKLIWTLACAVEIELGGQMGGNSQGETERKKLKKRTIGKSESQKLTGSPKTWYRELPFMVGWQQGNLRGVSACTNRD
jgi:hypothetical protein